jgi:hypothetical protein
MTIDEEAIEFCNGWSNWIFKGKSISRAEVTCILVDKKEQAVPIIKRILDPDFKNRWNVPYAKSNQNIVDGCLVAIDRLGDIARDIDISMYKDHPYHPESSLKWIYRSKASNHHPESKV